MATPAQIVNFNLPTVALVGRVNVGKSTLFNRLTESRQALVSNIPGTTRTRNISIVNWRDKNFRLIDTGGLTFSNEVILEDDIVAQTRLAIAEADLIIFVVDIQEGLLPQERELAKLLFKKDIKKPVLLVANKTDGNKFLPLAHEREWLKLGLGEPLPVSATSSLGVGDLLDTIYKKLGKAKTRLKKIKEFEPIKVALMGKPNVGKSSLFNKLIGEERVIVSPMPHTTREPHDTLVEYKADEARPHPTLPSAEGRGGVSSPLLRKGGGGGRSRITKQHILFIDTAGIRRKTKVTGELEKIGIGKSIETISKSDIVLLLLDASEPITDQDQQLAGLLREHTRSVIIVINKWDLADDNEDAFRNQVKEDIYKSFPHLKFAPIIFTSAKTGYKTHQIFPLILEAWQARQIVVDDEKLREFIKATVKKHLPTKGKGVRHPKILGMTQTGYNPPMFLIEVKANTSIHISYVHFIENQLRQQFGFFATPIIMKLSKVKR